MQAIRDLGAEVRLHGRDFDEARLAAEIAANAAGSRFVHSANEPKLIAGVGAIGLEIFDDLPEVEGDHRGHRRRQLRVRQLHRRQAAKQKCARDRCAIRASAGGMARLAGARAETTSANGD